jgi:outer membrane receptor protein involved in Fe transport
MKTKMMLLALLTVLCASAYAQTRSIHGVIANSEGKTIPFANVVLLRYADSSIVKVAATTTEGVYEIVIDSIADVMLKVDATGYGKQVRAVSLNDMSAPINFTLIAERSLKEVSISGRKPIIEEKVDRTIFNVENSITAIGGDAMDALKKTPGVLVVNGEITIAGKNSVSVMINGRLQQLSGRDLVQLLRSIPSDNLSKIEVITTPPAKYDAEGNSGMINLVTKKNLKNGLKGSATASYLQNSLGNPLLSTSLSYRKDKLNVFCNANAGVEAEKYTNRTTSFYPPQRSEQTFYQYTYDKNASVQLGADYQLHKDHTVGVLVTERFSRADNTDNAVANNFGSDNKIDSIVKTTGESQEFFRGKHALNLNYEWKIDAKGRKLNADADYFTQLAQRNRSFVTQGYTPEGNAGIGMNDMSNAAPGITIKSVKTDVEWPVSALTLSFGGKAAFIENTSDNVYKTYNGTDFVIDTGRSNEFSYSEQTQALYVSGQGSKGKFDIQAGLRAEHTFTKTYSPTVGVRNTNEYLQLFPTGYVQYKINDENSISVNYSRRINRPGYSSLNPFRFYFTSNFYTVGNPNLQPSFVNSLELAYRWKGKYSFKVFTRQADNYSNRLFSTDPATSTTFVTRANIGTDKYCGLNINGQFTVTKWWEMRNSANIAYNYYDLNYYGDRVALHGINEWFEIGSTFYLNKSKTLSAEVDAYYYTPRQWDYKIWWDMSCVNAGIKLQLLDNNLIIALAFEDLMAKAYWLQTNVVNNTTEYSYDNARGVRLSINYKFGNKNVKIRQGDHSNEEIQRVN